MSYPHAVATGNAVIAAALAWEKAIGKHWSVYDPAEADLHVAVAAHRAATAVEHTQGPDIDADCACGYADDTCQHGAAS